MIESIGFIGLENLGLAIATNLLKAGFGMRVYNCSAEKARPLLEQGASLERSSAEASVPDGVMVTMVSDDRKVEVVTPAANGAGITINLCSLRGCHVESPRGGGRTDGEPPQNLTMAVLCERASRAVPSPDRRRISSSICTTPDGRPRRPLRSA